MPQTYEGAFISLIKYLNLIQSSPVVTYDRPVNALCLSDKYNFKEDRFGSIGKWDLETLAPLDFLDGKMVCNRNLLADDEMPSLSPNRGIACLNGRLYTCNGYNQIVVIDAETFELLNVRGISFRDFHRLHLRRELRCPRAVRREGHSLHRES